MLGIGHKLLETAIQLQGNGDLNATCMTSDDRVLLRSQELHTRELSTIFGQHEISQFVYSEYENRKIELRPIDARLGLSPRVCSQLVEEFTQMFCVENAFGQAARNFQTVYWQGISVDTLEAVSRKMGGMAKEYSDQLPVPPREEEGEILVTTLDGQGVPLIRESEAKTEPVKAFQSRRLRLILQGRVKSVIRGLRYLATDRNLRGDAAQRFATISNYLDAHAERMRHHIYLAAGNPIATGVIEGACRHVVKDRMERTGMRWTLVAAKAMLNLRAVSASGHWDDFHTTRRQKEIERFHPHRAALKDYLPTMSL